MDILSHGLSGVAISTVVAAFSKKGWKEKILIGTSGLAGGVMPDIDVISAWGGFDATFGSWFGLEQSGREIFSSTHWYSHHVFTHSVLGALLFTSIGILLYKGIASLRHLKPSGNLKFYALAFFLGFMAHLFEDMITPGGPWNGIAFFWPSTQFTGGWGKTWWWNNYDLFLIIATVILINTGLIIARYKTKLLTSFTLTIAVLLFAFQVERRPIDFNKKSAKNSSHEETSLALQQHYLGKHVFYVMQGLDEIIPVAF